MLLVSMVIFFLLSFLLAESVWRLPVWCQSWTLTSVWGIFATGMFVVMVYPESYPYIKFMAFVFIAAYPGMLWLEFRQRWARVNYWESNGLPPQLQDKPIFWSHKADNLLEWVNDKLDGWAMNRVQRRLEQDHKEAVQEAERLVNGGRTS